jgi:hypothetical protein
MFPYRRIRCQVAALLLWLLLVVVSPPTVVAMVVMIAVVDGLLKLWSLIKWKLITATVPDVP